MSRIVRLSEFKAIKYVLETGMTRPVQRMMSGVYRLLSKDSGYFYSRGRLAGRNSDFREDLRAIIGGALAFGFIAAALTQVVSVPYDGVITLCASALGGLSGKYLLV